MKSDWKTHKLGELIRIKHGYAFKGEYFSTSGEYIVLTPGNFHDVGGFKLKDPEKYYVGPIPKDFLLKRGDLVIVMTEQAEGLLGSPAFIPESNRFLHNQRLGLVNPVHDDQLDMRFVYYLFRYGPMRRRIRATASGVKVRHTSPSRIYEIEAMIPRAKNQRKIASMLSVYDRLLENNEHRIRILEEIARNIFAEWFVKFRFPGHQDGGLIDSPAGKIPYGWRMASISDMAVVFRGRSYRSSDLVGSDGLPFINLKCIDRDGGFRVDGLKRYSGDYSEAQMAMPGDVVVAVTDLTQQRRIVAHAARVPDFGEPKTVFSMDLVKVAPKGGTASSFVYGALRYTDFSDRVKQYANGANVLHLNPSHIENYSLAVPPEHLQREYEEVASGIFKQCDLLARKNAVLVGTRDVLLSRLIAGELDVSDLDVKVEDDMQ